MHPFTGLATREDGKIQVCCRSHPIGDIVENTLEDIWNNDNMKRIRHQVLNNERPPECEPCFVLEDQGVESLRQRHIKGVIPEARINLYPNAMKDLREDMTMPFEIPTMEIKLNNLCNLKCRMCHPLDSTSWNDWDEVESFYKKENNIIVGLVEKHNLKRKPYLDKFEDNPNWWDSFEKIIPYFRRAEFAGGEPLMDPQHYRILDMLKPYGDRIEIKYATNLTMLGKGNRNIYDYWPHFKSVALNVSIDGMNESYEYIRGNGDWITLVENIKTVQKDFANISRIVGAVAVQVSNILILDEMIEYFLDDLGIVFYTNMVKYPNCLSIQVLPEQLKNVASTKLKAIAERLHDFKLVKEHPMLYELTMGQINGILNFLQAKDENHLWPDTVNFNTKLDVTRKQSFLDVTPEFKPYV